MTPASGGGLRAAEFSIRVRALVDLIRRSRAGPWVSTAARRLLSAADRPSTRPLIALVIERLIEQIHGEIATVRHVAEDDCWVIEWPGATVPRPDPWHAPSPSQEEEQARDVFFQEYTPVEGDVVVDVGAGIGTELNLFSRLVGPSGHVYAIEADPRTFHLLRRRQELNHLVNVTPIHTALADRPGDVLISSAGPHETHRLVSSGPGHLVRGATLDELVAEQGITRIDLLKMNIEGAERLAVAGMNTSSRLVRNVVISCHDYLVARGGDGSNRTNRFVREYLITHGFEVAGRRGDDAPDWARDYLYGHRRPCGPAADDTHHGRR